MNFRNLEEFWAFYVTQHSKASTRRFHFLGTLSALLCLLSSLIFGRWILLLAAPISGYGLAWYSHFFVEGNVPLTFGHPFWSFLCDLKMFAFMLTGQMDRELKRLGKRPVLQDSFVRTFL
ncbi:putative 2-hydroxy-palmitic acid dioxygenase Mpo1 [Dioscorea sansibarensis]